MKTVMTLLTFLIVMIIGSTTYAENFTLSAVDQNNLDEHTTTPPKFVTVPVTIPVISTDETGIDYSFDYEDDGC